MNGNYIKIDRKMLSWEWYQDINTKVVFFHCLLCANCKDGRFEGKEIKRGSFVTSLSKLSAECNLSVKQVRTALEHLKATNEVAIETTSKFRIITIKNYDLYQTCDSQEGKQTANEGQTKGKQGANDRQNGKQTANEKSAENLANTTNNDNSNLTINRQMTNNLTDKQEKEKEENKETKEIKEKNQKKNKENKEIKEDKEKEYILTFSNENVCNTDKSVLPTSNNINNTISLNNNINNISTITSDVSNISVKDIRSCVEKWNELQEFGVKKVSKIVSGTNRHDMLSARIRQYGIDDVLKAIDNVKTSEFLQGHNNRGWIITFDWFVRPNNFVKVLDGNYNNSRNQPKNKTAEMLDDFYKFTSDWAEKMEREEQLKNDS